MAATGEPVGIDRPDPRGGASDEHSRSRGFHGKGSLLMIFIMIPIMTPIMYTVNRSFGGRSGLMKVSREQVVENRRRILDAAAQLFRQRGFENVTVAEVMSAAGLTHGGFYGHFDSKEALINAAMAHEQTARRSRPSLENAALYADSYLSGQHRDNIGASCPFSSLGTDAARGSP